MRERESQLERDVTVDVDPGIDGSGPAGEREREESQESGFIRSRVGSVLSPKSLLIAVILSIVGMVLFSVIPFLSTVGTLLGIAGGGFVYGLSSKSRRYVEMALAGAIVGGGATLLGNLALVVLASGTTLVGIALLGSAIAGVVGHYFGRDLRDGLTKDLHED